MGFEIRKTKNIRKIKSIINNSILTTSREHYDEEQIKCLSDPDEQLLRDMTSDSDTITYLMYIDDIHMGFGSLDTEHSLITGLYISSEYKNSGYGTKLLSYLEDKSKELNIKGLTVYSSVESTGFYEKNGYRKIDTVTYNINGVDVPMCAMIKKFQEDYKTPIVVDKKLND
jgi:GNAT superfamily N-acetyltransferase